jgi:uncharacterized protein involved in exopolysaccharide biosynthesis
MQRAHRKAHELVWTVLAIVLPLALAIAFVSKPKLSSDAPSIRLDAGDGQDQP